jgi:succinoglycan biosynthesis transport protein ExoP
MNVNQLRLLLIVIRRRIRLICSCTGLALVLAAVYCVLTPRIYEATASMLVEYNHEGLNKSGSDLLQQSRFDDLTTQTKLIQSPLLVDRALASLQSSQMDPALANLDTDERRKAVTQGIQVSSPRGARLIHLAYRSPAPDAATAMVQALTDSYLKFVNETHRNSAREVLEVLTRQKDDLEGQLLEVDQKVMEMRQDAGVILGEKVRTSIYQKRMAALEEELLKAQVNCIRADGAYRQATNPLKDGNYDLLTLRLAGNLGQQLVSEKMGARTDYLRYWDTIEQGNVIKDVIDLQRISEIYGPNHPRYKSLKARVELLQAHLKNPDAVREDTSAKREQQVLDFVQKMTHQELLEAKAIEQELIQRIENEKIKAAENNAKHVRLQMVESKQERLKSFYDVVLKRMKELDVGENLAQINVTVVGQPTLLKSPVAPKIPIIMLLSLCGGLASGVGLAVLLDRLDNKFRGPEDIQHLLEVPVIGNVPTMKPDLECAPAMLMAQASSAVEAESFRSIRTWLFFAKDVHIFSITSPLQSDGKSMIIGNLATALAQTGKRTLLIDCDLRRPRQHSAWSLPPSRGISYLLQKGQCSPEAITAEVRASSVKHLDILPAGAIPAHPAELLEKPDLIDILQWAKATYEYVLIDAPPVIPVADPGTLARLVDGMILVVNVKSNGRGHAYQAKDKIVAAGGTLLGVIANGISHGTSYGYSYIGDGYGYKGYGSNGRKETEPTTGGQDKEPPPAQGDEPTNKAA